MGAGHSVVGNRFEYLRTCIWSLYEFFPHIVIAVSRQNDVDWLWQTSELPLFDVLLLDNLPKDAGLPVGSTQALRQKLIDGGKYAAFDFVFYTESDQILIARELQLLYAHLAVYPRHMLLPHRLMPYSAEALVEGLKRTDIANVSDVVYGMTRADGGSGAVAASSASSASAVASAAGNKWMSQSCCLPRQNCMERKTWKNLADQSVPIIQYYGMYVPLGNINFLREDYRYCKLGDYVGGYCP